MFKPVGPPVLNCLMPLALLIVLFLALLVAFSSGDLALADTVAIGAGGLGGGGGGGGGGGPGCNVSTTGVGGDGGKGTVRVYSW